MAPDDTQRRYRIGDLLGKGGFGSVYRADLQGQGGFTKPVAVKVLNADLEAVDDIAQRLRDEARILGRIRHRAIVQVDGLVHLGGRWAVVMEFVEGSDLRQLLALGPLPVGPALEIVQEVAAALHVAYDKPTASGERLRLLHRDIKPGNIQLTAAGEVKLLDFGIARAEFSDREAATRSVAFGSASYMSPERHDFLDSHAGDVFALAVVLFELLTAKSLGKTTANEQRHRDYVRTAADALRAAGVDAQVAQFVLKGLAFLPEQRPSAREFEAQARKLRQAHPEPSLGELAEERVPRITRARQSARGELTGTVMVEGGVPSAPAAPPRAARKLPSSAPALVASPPMTPLRSAPVALPAIPGVDTTWERVDTAEERPPALGSIGDQDTLSSNRPPPAEGTLFHTRPAVVRSAVAGATALVLLLGFSAGVGVAVVAFLAIWWATPAPVAVAPPPVSEAVDEVPSTEVLTIEGPDLEAPEAVPSEAPVADAPDEAPEPAPPPPAKVPSARREAPPASREPTSPPPREAPPPRAAAATAEFRADGDDVDLVLVRDGKRYRPGALPAGRYEMFARFTPDAEQGAGAVDLAAGDLLTIRCSAAFFRCQPSR